MIAIPLPTVLRFVAAIYLLAFALRMADGLVFPHALPDEAITYLRWLSAQPHSTIPVALSYTWLGLGAISWLAALGILLGSARWLLPFSLAYGGVMVFDLLSPLLVHLPFFVTPFQNAVADVVTLCAGAIVALGLFGVSRAHRVQP